MLVRLVLIRELLAPTRYPEYGVRNLVGWAHEPPLELNLVDVPALDEDTRSRLAACSTATLSTQLLKRGLRNTFMHGLAPLNPGSATLVAPAFTLRYIPAREDLDIVASFEDHNHPQRAAIERAPAGSVLVMDCRGEGRAASAGNILVARLQQRGVRGLITDGSVRDSPTIAQMDFPVFTASVSAMTNLAQHHAVDMNVPIGCAGVPVFPGDVIVADEEGVLCVPRHLAEEVAGPAAEQERLEAFLLAEIQSGAPLIGTYPPDSATMERYRANGNAS